MGYRKLVNSDQRLQLLQILEQDGDYAHNESVLQSALGQVGHAISSDLVRTHLDWLSEQGLVSIDKETVPALWIAKLTRRGADVARGHARVDGVARPRP